MATSVFPNSTMTDGLSPRELVMRRAVFCDKDCQETLIKLYWMLTPQIHKKIVLTVTYYQALQGIFKSC
jgi:hypothetical protein